MSGMEAAIASGILKIVSNKLAPLIIKEYSSTVGVKKDLEELQSQLEEINTWLEIAEDKAMGNDPTFNWLRQLKDVVCDVDDVVDEFQLKAEKHDAGGDVGITSKFMCMKPKSFIFQCKTASKIKSIKKRFAAIVKQRTDYSAITHSLQVHHPVRHMNKTNLEMPSLPVVDASSVLGRDREKHEIISKLVETTDRQKIKIVSVIGLGGSGKTTLAKLVFNDGNIVEKHFETRLWVHVSQEYNVEKLAEKLFEAFADYKSEHCPLQHMINKISEKLTGKRFLLVLDDVWTESRIQWEEFMVYLKSGAPGSSVLLTTRSSKVAETVGSTDLFDLPPLSLDESWQLFQQSFVMPSKPLEFEFEEVGKEIIKKCGGLPLAIKVIAGVLCGKERMEEWHAMRDSNLLDVEGEERRVFACLRLSYFHLPSHLKQCFTICSMIPKGHDIDKEQLIDQWIAHDMITISAGVDCLEYTGHKCFNSLVQMSFLQDVNEFCGRVRCRMHDLVHDLAQSILGDEISLVVPAELAKCTKSYRYFSLMEQPRNPLPRNIFKKARAIYVATGDDLIFGKSLKNSIHLRSIMVEYVYTAAVATMILQVKNLKYLALSRLQHEALPESISDIWSLQALHVTFSNLSELPKSIGKLQKLRTLNLFQCEQLKCLPDSIVNCQMISSIDLSYCEKLILLPSYISTIKKLRVLRLGYTKIERVPSSVTSLVNLECLDLRRCSELVELPEDIGNLEKLQVLNLEKCGNLRGMPLGIGKLSQLRKLGIFAADENENFARISELGNLTRIAEELRIQGVAHVMDPNDALKACLKEKMNLQSLNLTWGRRNHAKEVISKVEQAVLDGLEPPSWIKRLNIAEFAGGQFASWMLKQVDGGAQAILRFPCLTMMKLSNFPNLKNLEGLVELPCLEELVLSSMPSLESISGGPFPSLVEFKMDTLPSLKELWMVIEGTLDGEEGEGFRNHSCHHLGQMQVGSRLTCLSIRKCPKLVVKPHFPSSLEHLELQSNEQLLLLSPGQGQGSSSSSSFSPSFTFSHLKKLELSDMAGSGREWELLEHILALECLKIYKSSILTELPESIRSFTSLQSMCISLCPAICMLPEWLGELWSLQKMTIEYCSSLSTLPQSMGHLTSLQELRVAWCHELHQLPECLGDLISLRRLDIVSLWGLTCLPQSMCRLTSLEQITIWDCEGIKSLPEWINGLTAMQYLEIYGCPDLERRCERGKGEDWHLISCIPRRCIG
ncbi:unnamed protein product [Urochloa decumbens]|uniref:Uncharacterized protein n=1 Tax=Urochloa decumbens TaxID=240449 RepID=A0ABC9BB54_9POAL